MLHHLDEAGVRIAVCSSNAETNVRRTLGPELAGLIDHFECGAAVFGKRSKLSRIAARSGLRVDQVLCIGDEIRDIEAARAAGLPSGAVTWGATTPDAIAAAGPDELFPTVESIATRIVG